MTRDGLMIEPTLVIEPLPVEINKGSSEVSTMKIILNYVLHYSFQCFTSAYYWVNVSLYSFSTQKVSRSRGQHLMKLQNIVWSPITSLGRKPMKMIRSREKKKSCRWLCRSSPARLTNSGSQLTLLKFSSAIPVRCYYSSHCNICLLWTTVNELNIVCNRCFSDLLFVHLFWKSVLNLHWLIRHCQHRWSLTAILWK